MIIKAYTTNFRSNKQNIYIKMSLLRIRSHTVTNQKQTRSYNKIGSFMGNFDVSYEKLQKLNCQVNTTVDQTFDLKSRDEAILGYKASLTQRHSPIQSRVVEICKIQSQLAGQLNKRPFESTKQNKIGEDFNLKNKMNILFNLYLDQEILKHYCGKTGWKFQSERKLMENLVLPTLDLLSIHKNNMKSLFEPFLAKISERFLVQTQRDTFSRLSTPALLIEMTQVWVRIKQSEISLKRHLRSMLTSFITNFCYREDGIIKIDKKILYQYLFQASKQITMVNLIKIFIFCFKIEGQNGERGLEMWLEQY